jgi:hypothetical protein
MMNYERSKVEAFQNGARYHAVFSDSSRVTDVEKFLKNRAVGVWSRKGNSFFCHELSDIFHIRLFHNDGLKAIYEASGVKAGSQAA